MISHLGQSLHVDRVYRRVPFEIQGMVFPMDVIELSFDEFDLIFGMNWLVEYQVSLDWATKKVTLRTNENSEVFIVGKR